MRALQSTCPTTRPGKILALFALILVVLLGMVGLVVDGGLMMSMHRRSQNAADSGALAAAMELMHGNSAATAQTTATTFVTTHNGLSDATVTVNIPPATGPFAGNGRYAEVVVTKPINTMFVHLVGVSPSQQVVTRAVAGYEPFALGEGMILLDPSARPGLQVSGGATLRVDGAAVVNSAFSGVDQYGEAVNWGGAFTQPAAMATSNNSQVQARYFQVRGGVDVPANYQPYQTGDPSPLYCRAPLVSDPLRNLPTPVQSNTPSISDWARQPAVTVNNEIRTFSPGVYEDIQINPGATVFFQPGVYVFSPTRAGQGLRATGNCSISGSGVMFYLTGSNYLDNSPGSYDALDDAQAALDGPLPPTNAGGLPPATDPNFNQVNFASLVINANNTNVNLTGFADSSSPYNNVLIYQRRRNMTNASIQGSTGVNVNLTGTIYAKWAQFRLSGGGVYNSQFISGSMSVTGQAVVTINSAGRSFGRANQVFLVE